MSGEKEKYEWLKHNVNPILHKLVVDCVVKQPDDVLDFMKTWLKEHKANLSKDLQKHEHHHHHEGHHHNGEGHLHHDEAHHHHDEAHHHHDEAHHHHHHHSPAKEDSEEAPHSEEDQDEEEEEEDHVENLPGKLIDKNKQRGTRFGVSSEVYGLHNKKSDFKPKVVAKTEAQKERIRLRLSQAFMFSAIDEKEQDIVIDAMEELTFKTGDPVIQQGEDGATLYLVDSGALDCFRRFKKDEDEKHLKTYQPGESFGELALLYNAPRAATIRAKEDSVLFCLDRETFNHIVKDAAVRKREKYEDFLSKIDVLSTMDAYERSKIADALKTMKLKKGEAVFHENETGNTFFFVEEGNAVANKVLEEGKDPQIVYEYGPGDYFGELALLKDIPRQASIIATTDLSLVYLDRFSFKRLLGNLEDLLKRNFSKYEKFASYA